jgi:hypothetical protein
VRSGPGAARTILLLHIISVRPSKQPLMVRTFLKVYMELGSYFLFLQEQIKDIIIIMVFRGLPQACWSFFCVLEATRFGEVLAKSACRNSRSSVSVSQCAGSLGLLQSN